MCLFWGSFASAGPPNSFSDVLRLFFSQPQSLHVPWEVFSYLSGGATVVFLFYLVSHTGGSSVFPSSAASEAILGLSSIQIYFILQISGYGY